MLPWFFSGSDAAGAGLPAADQDWLADGAVPREWTLARPAAALGRGADGRWAAYPANAPRPYHDPATLARVGTLVEATAATQLIFRSRSAAGAVGVVANGATLSTVAGVQTPFGAGATRITPTAVDAMHGFNLVFGSAEAAAVGDGQTVSVRLVLKPDGAYTRARLFLRNRAAVYATVTVALEGAGSVVATTAGATATVHADTDGFYEVRVPAPVGTGTTAPACNLLVLGDDLNNFFTGDGTSGLLMAYMGAEAGPECSSPILSDGTAPVTRPAEVLSSQADWLGPGPKSFGIRYAPLSASPQTVLHLAGADLFELRHSAGTATYTARAQGAVSAQLAAPAPAPGVPRTVVAVAAPDEFRLAQDGAVVGTDPSGPVPADLTAMRLGSGAAGEDGRPVVIDRVKYWRRALSAAEAEAYSADLSLAGGAPALPSVEIQPARTVLPSETSVTLVATLTGEPTGPSVAWRTVDGTATTGVDYVGGRGIARFVPGEYSAEITVGLATRSTAEDRTFAVELVGPEGATLGNATCVVTLRHVVQQGPAAAVQNIFGATLPAEWSLTRSTAARTRNSAGTWVAVNANVHRHHHLAPGVSGILVQSATSEQRLFDAVDPGWTVAGSTKALDTTTATPFGTRSLKWRKDDAAGDHRLSATLTAGVKSDMPTGEYSLGMTLRPLGERYWMLRTKGIDNVWKQVLYDLDAAGAVVSQDTDVVAAVERDPFFADLYNVTLNRPQAASAGVSAEIVLYPSDTYGNVSTTGGTALGCDILHMQLEPGPSVGAPIVTTGTETAKVVRAGDVLKATGTWFQRQSYSLGIRYVRLRPAPSTQTVLHVRDTANSTTADAQHLLVENGALILRPRTGSVTLATVPASDGPAVPVGQTRTSLLVVNHAARMALFDAGAKVGEVPVGTGGVAAPLAPTILRFGSTEPGASNASSYLLQAAYLWNDPLSDADALLFSGNLAYSPPPEPDAPPVLSIPTALSVVEGQTLAVPVTKAGTGACSATFRTRATGSATWSTDYTGVETTVSFASGDTAKTVSVATVADAVADPGETLSILLEAPVNCTLGNAAGTVTIVEVPTVSIPAAATVEEGSAVSIPLSKTGTGACSVTVQTFQQTATAGVDYTGVSPTVVSFGATETTKTFTVQTTADAATEPAETFNLTLHTPANCVLGNATCAITINPPGTGGGSVGTAYPTPKGFATEGNFGLGGSVYRVTSLSDASTPGTLRHGLETAGTGGRLIVFEVAGIIKTTTRLRVGNAGTVANVTVAGETAPWPGITIQPLPTWNDPALVLYDCRNFNMSNIHIERPYADIYAADTNFDGWNTEPGPNHRCENIWMDHVSTFWTFDEAATLWVGTGPNVLQNISITNCMFAEPLADVEAGGGNNPHRKGGNEGEPIHNYNLLLAPYGRNVDVQYCLFTESSWRNPWVDAGATAVIANNVSVNNDNNCHVTMNDWAIERGLSCKVTCVGYLAISGPNTPADNRVFRLHRVVGSGHQAYASNLYGWRGAGAPGTPNTAVPTGSIMVNFRPIDCPTPVVALTDQQIYQRAVDNVGPRPKERGIPAVARAITKLRNKSGKWVNMPSEVGGISNYAAVSRPLGAAGASSSPGTFRSGDPIPPMPTAGNAATMRAYIRKFKDQVQYD